MLMYAFKMSGVCVCECVCLFVYVCVCVTMCVSHNVCVIVYSYQLWRSSRQHGKLVDQLR
jgi:hypothetical protein